MKKKEHILTALKGLIIGGTMLVPGVSGGSMAMILGIYNKLISSVSSFFKDKKNNIIFLAIFVAGALLGMLLFASPLEALINRFPRQMGFFFIGAVAGGIPIIYKESQVTRIRPKHILYIIAGIALVVLISFLPEDAFSGGSSTGVVKYLILMLSGIICAVALILPGISVSYMFLVMGIHDSLMHAISSLDILFLLPMAVGLGLGVILTTKLLEMAMKKFPHATYMIILGFVLGSIADAFPGVPMGWEWLICIVMLLAGFAAIFSISYFTELKPAKK